MRDLVNRAPALHAPAKREDYRSHLHEAATLCHRTGWIAVGEAGVTCSRCLRRLARKRSSGSRNWGAVAA